jgi:hypothetical protein
MQLDARFTGSTPEITTAVDLPSIAETTGVGNNSSTPVDSGPYLENKLRQNNSLTTSAHSSLIQELREHLGFVEDAVVTTLVANCREKQPDATIEEISHFAIQKALQISRTKSARTSWKSLPIIRECAYAGRLQRLRLPKTYSSCVPNVDVCIYDYKNFASMECPPSNSFAGDFGELLFSYKEQLPGN